MKLEQKFEPTLTATHHERQWIHDSLGGRWITFGYLIVRRPEEQARADGTIPRS